MYWIFTSLPFYHEFYVSLLLWNVIILFYIRIGYEGVIGESGVGKSFLTNSFIRRLSKEKFITNVVNFSARTNVNYTQVYSTLLNLLYMWQVLKSDNKAFWSHHIMFFAKQDVIMSKLDRRRKGVFGPAMGKQCIIFIDDLNLPQRDSVGSIPAIELLRQVSIL